MWVMRLDGEGPVRDSMWLHEYGKDNYWNRKMVWHALQVILILFFFCCSGTKQLSRHENRYGRPCESLCQYSNMPPLGVKLSLPSITHPTTVAFLQMHCLLAIYLSALEASSIACERDLITAEVYHKLW